VKPDSESGQECGQHHYNEVKNEFQPLLDHQQKVCWPLAGVYQPSVFVDIVRKEACITPMSATTTALQGGRFKMTL
jgi:hypothetical protein